MGGLPERERAGRERWIKVSERLEGCREVEAAGRVERQKEGGKAGQGKGQDNVAQMAKKVGWTLKREGEKLSKV